MIIFMLGLFNFNSFNPLLSENDLTMKLDMAEILFYFFPCRKNDKWYKSRDNKKEKIKDDEEDGVDAYCLLCKKTWADNWKGYKNTYDKQ